MPTIYEIRIEGHISPYWAEWLQGMTVQALDTGETLITGPLEDQAALHGLLNRIRDMNLKLVSVGKKEAL